MKEDVLVVLLQRKFESLNTLANVSMLWWVSSVVFCASILGAVWLKREDIKALTRISLHAICLILLVFFSSVVAYGIWAIYTSYGLGNEANNLLQQLHAPNKLQLPLEFHAFRVAVGIGTSSFTLVLIAWVGLWVYLARGK